MVFIERYMGLLAGFLALCTLFALFPQLVIGKAMWRGEPDVSLRSAPRSFWLRILKQVGIIYVGSFVFAFFLTYSEGRFINSPKTAPTTSPTSLP